MNKTTYLKHTLIAAFALVLLFSCSEQEDSKDEPEQIIQEDTIHTSTSDTLGNWALGETWPMEVRNQAVCFVLDGYAYVGLGIGVNGTEYTNFRKMDLLTGNWTTDLVAPFPGEGRHAAVAFTINGKAYVGLGYRCGLVYSDMQILRRFFYDFYEYDPTGTSPLTTPWGVQYYQGVWRKVADFPHETPEDHDGGGRRDAIGFSFPNGERGSNFGYVGLGRGYNDVIYSDFYSYDPATDKWTSVRDISGFGYPGLPRYGASVFVVDGSAYICLGATDGATYSTENIKFTPDGNGGGTFERMTPLVEAEGDEQHKGYDNIPRAYAVAFTSNAGKDGRTYGYVTGGHGTNMRSTWRYDHINDRWHPMADLPTSIPDRTGTGGVAFSVRPGNGPYTYGMFTLMGGGIDQTYNATLSAQSWWFHPGIQELRDDDYVTTPVGQIRYGD